MTKNSSETGVPAGKEQSAHLSGTTTGRWNSPIPNIKQVPRDPAERKEYLKIREAAIKAVSRRRTS